MALDKDTVRKIARLARIEVNDDALDGLAGELNNILDWIEQLDEVDTEGVAPLASVVDVSLALRDDVVDDGGYADRVLANAPDASKGFFAVPKVVE